MTFLTSVTPLWVCASFSTPSVLAQTSDAQNYHADLLLNLGIRQHKTGQFAASLDSLQNALTLYQKLGDAQGIGNCLGSLGDTYFSMGQYPQAAGFYHQSLILKKAIGDRTGEVEALLGLSKAYLYLRQEERAKKFEQQAQVIRREIGNPRRQAAFLNNLALDSQSQGEYEEAIAFHLQQLKIAREIDNPTLEAESLQKLAQAYELSGQSQKAIELYQLQLEFAQKSNDNALEAIALSQLANAYELLGQSPKAIELYQQQLEIARKSGNRAQEAIALNQLAIAFESQGQFSKAIELYQQQLEAAKKTNNRLAEGTVLNNLALASLKANNLTEAQPKLLDAMKVWDAIRTQLGNDENYYAEQARSYRLLQQVHIAQNQPEAALEIAEQGRVKEIVQLLNLRLSSEPVGTGLKAAPAQINLPTILEIKQIAKAQNATLVEYSVISDQELFVWVIQPSGEIAFRRINVKEQKTVYPITSLQEVVNNSIEAIGVKGKSPTSTAEPTDKISQNQPLLQLNQLLIKPIEDLLPKDSKQHVIFIPHQELFFVPFPALVDITGKSLIEKHTILTSPAIQVLALTKQQRKQVSGNKVLVMGNPTMPNMTVGGGESSQSLPPLLRGEQESLEIAQFLKTQPLIGNQATKSAFLEQLPSSKTIHLATYGLLDDIKRQGVPGGIALAPAGNDNGILTAAEILNLYEQTKDKKSPLRAELVVLSAGNIGAGNLKSDGLIGLSMSLIAAGVPSIVMSFGSASDASTTDLMIEFYRQLKQTNDKAQALRQAMLTTMKKYPNSRVWAAFTLMGEAK
ncbi:CHAT domain-containing protein [Allocoleopsis franciscana]|nr:CHAT domain-containing tetratricopeptide repeat protein [Allocoleopsis franciscana]